MPEQKKLLDDLLNACASKKPSKVAAAFGDLMTGKTYERIQAERQDVAMTMNQPSEEPVTEGVIDMSDKSDDFVPLQVRSTYTHHYGQAVSKSGAGKGMTNKASEQAYNHIESRYGKDMRTRLEMFHKKNKEDTQ